MICKIAGQLAQRHMKSTKGIEIKQVVIHTVGVYPFFVELKMGYVKDIKARIITDEVRSP